MGGNDDVGIGRNPGISTASTAGKDEEGVEKCVKKVNIVAEEVNKM